MKRLVLMRHAKAEHYNVGGDHERSLTGRGRSDAAAAGLVLAPLGLQRAIVSTAARTRETFECLGVEAAAEYAAWLYHCGADTLLERIRETSDDVSGLIVVGHAPTVPALAAHLADACDPAQADELASWFPTAAFAEFTFDGPWASLATQPTQLRQVHR